MVMNQNKTIREERRPTNEECYWCVVNSSQIQKGTILNESATGVLLRISTYVEVGKKVYILSLPGGLDSEVPTSLDALVNHPFTRSGTVVRHESQEAIGIQFYGDPETRPEFRRWFRGQCTIAHILFADRSIYHVAGKLTLEAAALLQTLFIQPKRPVKEILLSCYELEHIAGTASTLLRSALLRCDQEGIVITILSGNEYSPCAKFNQNLILSNGCLFPLGQQFSLPENASESIEVPSLTDPIPTAPVDEEANIHPQVAQTEPHRILLIAKNRSTLSRLAMPFKNFDFDIVQATKIPDALESMKAGTLTFIILDFDIEQSSLILGLNKCKQFNQATQPPLLVLGPKHLADLVKEALVLPVTTYLNKPFT
ncbi:hypothetical protein GF373_02845, partial [bacterium]|nr:hypothetical protein [bacterium]